MSTPQSPLDFAYSFYNYIVEAQWWQSRHDWLHKVGECRHCPFYMYRLPCIIVNGPHFECKTSSVALLSCFKNNAPCMSTRNYIQPMLVQCWLWWVKHMVCYLQCQLLLPHSLIIRNAWPKRGSWPFIIWL